MHLYLYYKELYVLIQEYIKSETMMLMRITIILLHIEMKTLSYNTCITIRMYFYYQYGMIYTIEYIM